jgi:hypothetical protein
MELDEPPREDVIMTIYDGHRSPRNPSSLRLEALGHRGIRIQNFQYLCILMYVAIWICTL